MYVCRGCIQIRFVFLYLHEISDTTAYLKLQLLFVDIDYNKVEYFTNIANLNSSNSKYFFQIYLIYFEVVKVLIVL